MATQVVSFREDEALLDEVRGLGLKPSDVAKEAFEKEIARIRRMGALAYFKENPLKTGGNPEAIFREMRDR